MKKQILLVLGQNHSDPIQFTPELKSGIYGLYTWRGEVYVFQKTGNINIDIDFEDLTEDEKKEIETAFNNKDCWKVNKTLQ